MTLWFVWRVQMAKQFSNFSLTMANLYVGLCRGVSGLPMCLYDLGYIDHWLENEFSIGPNKKVEPDMVLVSDKIGHTLLLEWKSGANTEDDQLERYSQVTKESLRNNAQVSADAAERHDVSIVGLREHENRLVMGVTDGAYTFPVLSVDPDGITLCHNSFECKELTSVFSPKLLVDMSRIPMRLVPFNGDSMLWEVAEAVIPQLLEYMSRRLPHVDARQVSSDICRETWSIMGNRSRTDVETKVIQVLKLAANGSFKRYLKWEAARKFIAFQNNPLQLGSDKRTTEFRKLEKLARGFIDSLRRNNEGMQQMELF